MPGTSRSRSDVALRAAAWGGAAAGFSVGVAGAFWGVVKAEVRLARRTIGEPTGTPPVASGSWGYGRRGTTPLRLAVIGDSSAAGLGARVAEETPGGRLAGALARELKRRVLVDVVAVVGARSQDLDAQVAHALREPVELAVVMIGANDVTHRVPIGEAARDLGRAITTLRAAGAEVVVGTCPDLGTVEPLLQPLRIVAALISRRLARAQTVSVAQAGGTAVSLGSLLADEFSTTPHLWSADRFHPSASGYRRVSDVLLPACLQLLGAEVPGQVITSEVVQHVQLAALQAAVDPGLAVEAVEGSAGAAAAGPGRLVRLVRRVPLVGRGAPEGRTADVAVATDAEAGNGSGDLLVTDE